MTSELREAIDEDHRSLKRELREQPVSIRPYQETLLRDAWQALRAQQRGPWLPSEPHPVSAVLQAATGSGKTHTAAEMVRQFLCARPGSRVQFWCDLKEITSDTVARFRGVGLDVGVVAAGHPATDASAQVVQAQTAIRRTAEGLARPDLLILDEAHICEADDLARTLRLVDPRILVGLTATPSRGDGKGLGRTFRALVQGPQTGWLQAHGWCLGCGEVAAGAHLCVELNRWIAVQPYLVPLDTIAPSSGYLARGLAMEPVEAYRRFCCEVSDVALDRGAAASSLSARALSAPPREAPTGRPSSAIQMEAQAPQGPVVAPSEVLGEETHGGTNTFGPESPQGPRWPNVLPPRNGSGHQRSWGGNRLSLSGVRHAVGPAPEGSPPRPSRALVFCADGAAKSTAQAFTLAGIPAEVLAADTRPKVRAGQRERVRTGQTLVICTVDCAIKGYDLPPLDTVILARPVSVPGVFLQMVGRALRRDDATAKTRARLIDLRGNVYLHGLPEEDRVWSLGDEAVTLKSGNVSYSRCVACGWLGLARRGDCPRCTAPLGRPVKPPRVLRAEKLERLAALPWEKRRAEYERNATWALRCRGQSEQWVKRKIEAEMEKWEGRNPRPEEGR